MKRLMMVAGLLALLAMPVGTAAAANPTKADKREAQRECRAERGDTDASREAFKAKYRNFGACVSKKAREAKAERKAAKTNASRACRAERAEDPEAFRATYRNFGKCVSQKAREDH